jgi:bifunctional UDP-N-acetylglucosamine pyrophosphorylase/glucosamine-1-phosphate N-acetyltransferase
MGGDMPKILQPCLERPMVEYPLRVASMLPSDDTFLVIGYKGDSVIEWCGGNNFGRDVLFVEQKEQLGTGHAVLQVCPLISEQADVQNVLVMAGDAPILDYTMLLDFIHDFNSDPAYEAGILTTKTEKSHGFGRIIRAEGRSNFELGVFAGTIEEKDIPQDRQDLRNIKEISTGTLIFRKESLCKYLALVGNNNKQGEYYLPDVVNLLHRDGFKILAHCCLRIPEIHGANDMNQLKELEDLMRG